jgi:hypothetical protein
LAFKEEIMTNSPVNALVRVSTNNELDFNEWLDYHIALGFNRIYVYDTGSHGWLPEACRKREDRVTLVPMTGNDWRKKSNIIKSYVAQATEPSWAVCLEDDEFIWIDLNVSRSISGFINKYLGSAALAMSVYVKYLSSEKAMKSRVGTLIDCFQHARPNPQGLVHPCSHTPNFTFTFFYVPDNRCVPMRGPLTPNTQYWRDSKGTILTEAGLGKYLTSQQYNPDAYPVRGYKYGLKSGIEMGMKPGTKPVGYTVRDNSMVAERAALLNIPVNEATEKLFAKDDLIVEQPTLPKRELSPEEAAELELPIPLGKFDTFILYGYPLEHVIDFAAKNGYEDTPEHRAVIERVYRRECSMIIESTPVYKRLAELDAEGGRTDDMICAELKISYPALLKMRKCMSVLNIAAHEAESVEAAKIAEASDKEQAKTIVESSDIAELTKQFDESVNSAPITKEDEKRFDDEVETRKAKRRESSKRAREKKKADKEAKKASEADTLNPGDIKIYRDAYADASYALIGKVSDKEPPKDSDVELDLGETNLLENTDLSSLGL